MPAEPQAVILNYGTVGRYSCEVDAERVVLSHAGPNGIDGLQEAVRAQLQSPLEFPGLAEAVVPGDRIVVALDRETLGAPEIVAEIWRCLAARDVTPADVTILQPASTRPALHDPRRLLPRIVQKQIAWSVHDPHAPDATGYLASSVSGARIYLARALLDADLVAPVGPIAFDPLLGYLGTHSVLYPGLSTADAIARSHGEGHSELGPDDERPLRQLIDEVAWLLGIQFAVAVLPAGCGRVARVFAGNSDAVMRAGKRRLNRDWRVRLEHRADVVVAAVDADDDEQTWEQIGAALETAQRLVARGGKIVILSQLDAALGPGLELLRDGRAPRDVLQAMRAASPPDLIAATRLAHAADWADVYFLSRVSSELVEELFMIPLESEREVSRLLAGGSGPVVLLGGAQHVYAEIGESG